MTSTPPGWYDDGHRALRWWDGIRWTEHVATPAAPAVAEADERQPTAAPSSIDPNVYPTGHAATSPGASGTGAFVAATEPNKSRAWIIWVVAGVVLLGIVIAAAVLIPLFFLGLATAGKAPSGEEETRAVATVETYDEAWREVDCEKFLASTTENFREMLTLRDCAAFEPAARDFADSVQKYELTVTGIERVGDSEISVATSETYESFYDETGAPVDPPVPLEDRCTYSLVPAGGGWAIDNADAAQ